MPVPKSARPPRYRDDSAKARRRGVIIIIVVMFLAGGLGWFLIWANQQRPELGADLCPKDPAFRPPKIVVILFDQTDKLTELHQNWLRSYFRRLLYEEFESEQAQEKKRFSRIELYSFRTKAKGAELDIGQILAICNPGSVTGLTKYTENPAAVRRNFETKFLERLNNELQQLLDFKDSPKSPILEALKLVALQTFANPKYEGSEKLLIVASDLMQNTSDLDLFKLQPKFEDFYRTPYGNRMIGDFKSTEVRLLVFAGAAEQKQRIVIEQFWFPYFSIARANRTTVKMVPNAKLD